MSGIIPGHTTASLTSETTGDILLSVTTGGNDSNKPARITTGDLSASPFLTIQAAIDSLPKIILHSVVISVGAGTFAGYVVEGFTGDTNLKSNNPQIRIYGTTSLATVTGINSGTATSGSTSTLVRTGAGWTVNALRGKFVKITAGSGAPTLSGSIKDSGAVTLGLITSNTIDTINLRQVFQKVPAIAPTTIAAIDGTSVFQIVDMGTIVQKVNATSYPANTECVLVVNTYLSNVDISQQAPGQTGHSVAVNCLDVGSVGVNFCQFSVASSSGVDLQNYRSSGGFMNNNYFSTSTGTNIFLFRANETTVFGTISTGAAASGVISVEDCFGRVRIEHNDMYSPGVGITVQDCAGSLRIRDNQILNFATNGLEFFRNTNLQTNNANIGTGAGGSSFGVLYSNGMQHLHSASSTITGAAGDMQIDGTTTTYATLTAAGTIVGARETVVRSS